MKTILGRTLFVRPPIQPGHREKDVLHSVDDRRLIGNALDMEDPLHTQDILAEFNGKSLQKGIELFTIDGVFQLNHKALDVSIVMSVRVAVMVTVG